MESGEKRKTHEHRLNTFCNHKLDRNANTKIFQEQNFLVKKVYLYFQQAQLQSSLTMPSTPSSIIADQTEAHQLPTTEVQSPPSLHHRDCPSHRPMLDGSSYLSSQNTAQQVPETDIARISFYLRCCVLGCGLLKDRIPNNIIDFTKAQRLSYQWQDMICRMAFEGFALHKLQNRVIFVDTEHSVLPTGSSTMFLKSQTSESRTAVNLLLANTSSSIDLPSTFDGNIMICSSEWIEKHYVLPCQRYYNMMRPASSSCASQSPTIPFQEYHQLSSQYLQSELASLSKQDESFLEEDLFMSDNDECRDGDDDDVDDDDIVPMVHAIPVPMEESTVKERDVVNGSLIVKGQTVKFIGLEMANMNELVGIVQERVDNRVIVDVPNHEAQYSLRLENIIIVLSEEETHVL